jgi:glycosyltransferase involved in cell wall biosynthesis
MDADGRIRVLFPYADGDTLGGSYTSSLALAAGLDRREFLPIVLLHGAPGALGRHVEGLELKTLRLEHLPIMAGRLKRRKDDASFLRYLLCAVPSLVRVIRQEQIDIVHTNDGGMHANWALPIKIAGARHVWHHRQLPDARGANLLAPLLADRILAVSHFSRPERPIRDITDRFNVVRSPFDPPRQFPDKSECRKALLQEIGAPSDAVLIGFFGALSPRKRADHFIRVVAEVRDALPERHVHGVIFGEEEIAGSGVYSACQALSEELGLQGQIHMMGYRSPVEPLIAAVDVHAVTALNEPFGRTLIEAMQLETPVVATRHGGNTEAIIDGETGYLVDPDLPSAFVPPIMCLMRNPATQSEITRNAKVFARGLTTEVHVEKVSAIYRQLVRLHHRPDSPPRHQSGERAHID